MRVYKTRDAAARRHALRIGVRGGIGGWLYDRQGRKTARGWNDYGRRLHRTGVILFTGLGWVERAAWETAAAEQEKKEKGPPRRERTVPEWRKKVAKKTIEDRHRRMGLTS